MSVREIAERAAAAARALAGISGAEKTAALNVMAEKILEKKQEILAANREDVKRAGNVGLEGPMLKRLLLDGKAFDYISSRMVKVARLPDPVGKILDGHERPDGLLVRRVSVPIGAMISPVGPIEPATTTGRPALSAMLRPISAPARVLTAVKSSRKGLSAK